MTLDYDLCVGKVVDEPDTWVLGTIKEINTKYAVICQRYEYPFAKCCGVGDFEVYTDSLIKVPNDWLENENRMLREQVEAECKENLDFYNLVEQKMAELDEKTKEIKDIVNTLVDVNKVLNEQIAFLEHELRAYMKALELACKDLFDAKDMLRAASQRDWADMLCDSEWEFVAKAKEAIAQQDSEKESENGED